MPEIDDEIRSIFAGTHPTKRPCEDCGGVHERTCPRVRKKKFHPNGNLAEVVYWHIWNDSDTLFPEDAYE